MKALLLGSVMLFGASGVASAESLVSTFGKACLESQVTRESISAIAASNRWGFLGSEAVDTSGDWADYYQAGRYLVHLDYIAPSEDSAAEQLICVVLDEKIPRRWEKELSEYRFRGDPIGEPASPAGEAYSMPEGVSLTIWDLSDGSRIHALADGSVLELSVNYPSKS